MRRSIRSKVLLAGACTMFGLMGWGQKAPDPAPPEEPALEVSVLYSPLMTNVVAGNTFWMQGGSLQIHGRFWRGLGVVADVSGFHSGNMDGTGVGLDLVTATFGPRYTWTLPRRRYSFYGQALGGVANGMNSIFPASTGTTDNATSLASYFGGGLNIQCTRRVSVHALDAGWLRTQLPNLSTGVQNNLRLGTGLTFRFR